eukprot:365521-Chlamydomonas_euryale.AAC.1
MERPMIWLSSIARLGTHSASAWQADATSTCRDDHRRQLGVPAWPGHVATSAPVAMLHTRMLRSSQPCATCARVVVTVAQAYPHMHA